MTTHRDSHSQRSRAPRQQGMTLIEIMVVTLIMALISTGIAVAVMNHLVTVRKETAKTDIRALKTAAKIYAIQTPGTCPDIDTLVAEGMIEDDTRRADPWETPYIFECSGSKVAVYSAGPDKQDGTEDDVR